MARTNAQLVTKSTRVLRKIGIAGTIIQANSKLVAVNVEGKPRETSAALRDVYGVPSRHIGHYGEVIRDFASPVDKGGIRMTVYDGNVRVEFCNYRLQ